MLLPCGCCATCASSGDPSVVQAGATEGAYGFNQAAVILGSNDVGNDAENRTSSPLRKLCSCVGIRSCALCSDPILRDVHGLIFGQMFDQSCGQVFDCSLWTRKYNVQFAGTRENDFKSACNIRWAVPKGG